MNPTILTIDGSELACIQHRIDDLVQDRGAATVKDGDYRAHSISGYYAISAYQ
jgi:hypothetical protein